MSFEEYNKASGEPAGIQPKIWNGELMEYQRTLLKKLYKLKNQKDINSTILELIRSTYHTENEFRKADFYKTEFDHFCDFLNHFDVLSSTKLTEDVMDEFGKMHKHSLSEQRSLVKSIPEVRALMQGA